VTVEPSPAGERLVRERLARLLSEHDPGATDEAVFRGARFDAGLARVDFPPGCGGLGAEPALQGVADDLLATAGVADGWPLNPVGVGAVAAAVVAHGTDAQRARWLRPIFTCEEVWCLLYTEPGAGSDLAAVTTAAVHDPDGEVWTVTGHKVFSTLAHVARWGLLLARSDPDGPKHGGLTCLAVDMRAPGVQVRPLRQMDGDAEFDEVLLHGVRVPDCDRIGGDGNGWTVALTTLDHERQALARPGRTRGSGPIAEALRLWREQGDHDPVMRDRLARLWIEAEAARLTAVRVAAGAPSAAPVARLLTSEVDQRIWEFCVELLGPSGALYDDWNLGIPRAAGESGRDVRRAFLRSRALTIQGGTAEISRSLLAERVLGLPPEPRSV